MENLHLKNLTTNKLIDYYINEIEKINKRNNNFTTLQTACKIINNDTNDLIKDFQSLTKLLKQLYKALITELERIDIVNPKIKSYRSHTISYIEDIIHYEIKELTIYNYYEYYVTKDYKHLTNIFKHEINQLNLLKNIDINSKWIEIDYEYHYEYGEYLNLVVFESKNHLTTLIHDLTITIDDNNIIKDIETNHS